VVSLANYNSHEQIVIGGHKSAVKRAMVMAEALGAKLVVLIPMSVPSHCPLMKEAAMRLGEILQRITMKHPKIPVLHNVDVRSYGEPEKIRDALMRQLYHPVLWEKTILTMRDEGVQKIIECGPGKVLMNLTKRIDKSIATRVLGEYEKMQTVLQEE
jgi:[acyl-carrier-protein] S-malonyltransferase